MTVAEPLPTLPPDWREWPDDKKKLLLSRLRAIRRPDAVAGDVRRSWDTPSALARDLFPGYVRSPHLDKIDEAFVDADQGKYDRILICTPPQVGKSTTAAEAGPLWWLSKHPLSRVTAASYSVDLAARRGEKCRDTIAFNGDVLGLALSPGSRAAAEWDLTTGGGMRCMGVSGGLTGFGSDLMVVDDPHKNREEANSKRMRDTVWGFYQSTVETRMSPGSPVILIMTRWHEDDLAARVLANEGRVEDGGLWHVISLAAIAEGRTPKGEVVIDPLGRKAGDPLTHPKLPNASRETLLEFWLRKRKAVGSREWPALYQQRPSAPEGTIFKHDWITAGRIGPEDLPPLVAKVVSVDPAGTATATSDETGIVIVGADARSHGYVLGDRSGIFTPADWGRRVCYAYVDYEANEIAAEQNQGYEMVQDVIKNAWKALAADPDAPDVFRELMEPRVVKVHSRIGKVLRAEPVAAVYERVEVHHVGSDLDELEDQMTSWTGEGDSPDRIDAMVHGVTHLLKHTFGGGRTISVGDLTL